MDDTSEALDVDVTSVDVNDELNAVDVITSVRVLGVTAGEVDVVPTIVDVDGSAVVVS